MKRLFIIGSFLALAVLPTIAPTLAATPTLGVQLSIGPSPLDTQTKPIIIFSAIDGATSKNVAGVSAQISVTGPSPSTAQVYLGATQISVATSDTIWNMSAPIATSGTYTATATYTDTTGIYGVTNATTTQPITVAGPAPSASGTATPPPAATQSTQTVELPNPITCSDATCLISQVVRYILGAIAVVATLMFVWGGVMMLTSGGNADQVKRAKETLVWATIGIIVILLSWVIIKAVLQALTNTA